jgi:hypothetical protein
MCICIMAMRTIAKGEEITYDYRYESLTSDRQECHCGAANCTGYLGSVSHAALVAEEQQQEETPLKKVVRKVRGGCGEQGGVGMQWEGCV